MELFLEGPAGRLEALYWPAPDGTQARTAAVVLHPHPRYGGTMHNTIVFRIARALRSVGLGVLRINFRGVERSEGSYDGEGGEEQDAAAGLDWLEEHLPGSALWGAGFSFGARTMAGLALRDRRVKRLILVAMPYRAFECPAIDRLEQPGLMLFGGRDELGTAADLYRSCPHPPPELEIVEIPEADHLFHGRTPLLEERVRSHAQAALGVPGRSAVS